MYKHYYDSYTSNRISKRSLKYNTMKKNMGYTDRIVRFIVAIAIALLYYFGILQGTLAYVLLAFGGILLVTGFISTCPLYSLVGLNTCKVKN